MIWAFLIEYWSLVMRTRGAEKNLREEKSERKGGKGEPERLKKGEREGEACYFTAVWKIWLT